MLIDWDYETRLIDRIAAREVMRATLTPRETRVLSRHLYGDTVAEIADLEGVSGTRINQILGQSISRVQRKLADVEPRRTKRSPLTAGFDKAAFLTHMRALIELRAMHERMVFQQERSVLDAMLARETEKKAPPQPKASPPVYKPKPAWVPLPPRPAQPLSPLELAVIASRALEYFLGHRKPTSPGRPTLGTLCTRVAYTREGGLLGVAMDHMLREIPADAALSAFPFPITDGSVGEHSTTPLASLRAISSADGLTVLLDMTWDSA